ncbi:uncharacterized protein LOC106055325 isoform X3 [Biomphalaria glabrata]|uniref:Uncharacterized protein LOC106055325 isoform X3 n=1 Tax=Biomphalaria glabrata TaxID=6526 RepID=A0A9W2ZAW8_BIOGL|nr:uncharacterized protein LOC106055325 isoform X3 [Biomphalaria glabrata]
MDQRFVVCLIIGFILEVTPGVGATTSTYPPWRTSQSTNSWTARPAYVSTKSVTEGSSLYHIRTFVQAAYDSCTSCYSSYLDVTNKYTIFDACRAFEMFDGCTQAYCYTVSISDNMKDSRYICDQYFLRSHEVGVSMSSAMSYRAHWMISALIFMVTLVFRTL